MERSEITQVLSNWIAQASSDRGKLAEGTDPAKWVAEQFINWWHPQIDDSLSDAEAAAARLNEELKRLGGWENKDLCEALHELTHIAEALRELRGD